MSKPARIPAWTPVAALAGLALLALLTVAGRPGELTDDGPRPTATPADADTAVRQDTAAAEEKFAELHVTPADLQSLPRRAYNFGIYQYPMPTFTEMFTDHPGAAEAVVHGRVTKVLRLFHNRAEMEFEVTRVLAARPGTEIKRGPIVLVEGMNFQGPPAELVYDPRRWPLFPGDEAIFVLTTFDLAPYYVPPYHQWIPLIDRGVYQVSDGKVSALTLGSDGGFEMLPTEQEADRGANAVFEWGQKYTGYPLDQFVTEIAEAAASRGWAVDKRP